MQQAIIIFVCFPEQVPLQQSNIMGYITTSIIAVIILHTWKHAFCGVSVLLHTLESNATTRTGAYESLLSIAIKPFFYAHCM